MTTSLAAYDTDCRKIGGLLTPDARIYLCGRVTVERNGRVLTDAAFGALGKRLVVEIEDVASEPSHRVTRHQARPKRTRIHQ